MAKQNDKIKLTAKRLSEVRSFCKQYVRASSLTKFSYACKRVAERADKVLEKIDDAIDKKRTAIAVTDDKGVMILDEKGNSQVPKDKLEGFRDFIKKELEKEVEIEPWTTDYIEPIKESLDVLELLNGIVIQVDIEKMLKEKTV